MTWLHWTVVALCLFGSWGVVTRIVVSSLDWRLIASFSIIGYAIPVAVMWAVAPPPLDGLTWFTGLKALSVGLLTQTALVLFYRAVHSGGNVSVIVGITSLYPGITLVGAFLFLSESVSTRQLTGAILALAAGIILSQEDRRSPRKPPVPSPGATSTTTQSSRPRGRNSPPV